MDLPKDFSEFCALLNARNVDFLIVGGYAVAFHGAPRFTGDLDIFVRPTAEQVKALLAAIHDFGFPVDEVSPEDLLTAKRILQLGRVPVQIHIMAEISGVTWDEAWSARLPGTYGGIPVFYIGFANLRLNKQASGRPKDLADLDALRRIGKIPE